MTSLGDLGRRRLRQIGGEVGDRHRDVGMGVASSSAAMAPLPEPNSSTSPAGWVPYSAQGSKTRRVAMRQGALRQNAASNLDIVGMDQPPTGPDC